MKVKKLTTASVLTAVALIIYMIEVNLPSLTPVQGIKLGLANIVSLFAVYVLGPVSAFCILLVRIILGSMLSGRVTAMLYSLGGGLLSFALVCLIWRFFKPSQMWIVSALSAIVHNIGQIAVAVFITGTREIVFYLPVLIVSGIITGVLTGLAAQAVTLRLADLGFIRLYNKKEE